MTKFFGGRLNLVQTLRLILAMGHRDLRNRYAGSYAGVAWNIGVPLLYSIVNVFVFSILMSGRMGARYHDVPFAVFYFSGFLVWTVFAETANRSTNILREYGFLISKIAFPVWIIPLIPFASALISQALVLAILFGLMAIWGIAVSTSIGWILPVWLFATAMSVGIAYGIAAIGAYVPDAAQIVPLAVNVLFFLSPLLYPPSLVESLGGPIARTVLIDANPFYYMIEAARAAVLGRDGGFPTEYLAILAGASVIALALGAALFRHVKGGFADVL